MNRALVLAAFLGLAASYSVTGWTYNKNLLTNDYLKLAHKAEFDFGYGTTYAGMLTEAMAMQSESYGAHAYSYAKYTFHSEWAKYY